MPDMQLQTLPAAVQEFIAASNGFDLGRVVASFAADALVNDQQREYAGWDAIRNWAAREMIGDRVTMAVTDVAVRGANVAVAAAVDGNYDKTGLPDPLVLNFYFSVVGDRIGQLVILRNKAPQVNGGLALPTPLDAYFAAKNGRGVAAMLESFAEDAVVVDEARDMTGKVAIGKWMRDADAKHPVGVEPLTLGQRGDRTIVAALVSGDFPGSPVTLQYSFGLRDNLIAHLEIGL
jgi:ketosteroid isomerase-like protein